MLSYRLRIFYNLLRLAWWLKGIIMEPFSAPLSSIEAAALDRVLALGQRIYVMSIKIPPGKMCLGWKLEKGNLLLPLWFGIYSQGNLEERKSLNKWWRQPRACLKVSWEWTESRKDSIWNLNILDSMISKRAFWRLFLHYVRVEAVKNLLTRIIISLL